MKILRILAPLDDTAISAKALDTVRHMAATVDTCSVELLHALAPAGVGRADERLAHAQEFLAREAAELAGPHLEASCRVEYGDAAEAILSRVGTTHFDFICMTTRSVPNGDGQPGSVATRLFEECPIPIIALPANSVGSAEAIKHAERAYFRAAVYLPADLEVEGVSHPIKVIIKDLSAKGAEMELQPKEVVQKQSGLLAMTFPTRAEPLEVPARIVGSQQTANEVGEPVQVLHVSFEAIRIGDQDAIVAFLNRLRTLDRQLRRVTAPVHMEVITGPRAYANFEGQTYAVRPDYMWLHMRRFDHIEGADVTLRVGSPGSAETVEVEGTVTAARQTGEGFDAEVEVAESPVGSTSQEDSGDKLMRFVRQHYGEQAGTDSAEEPDAPVLIPRHVRPPRPRPRMARVVTAEVHEVNVPIRAPKPPPGTPLKRQARDAEERALDSILRPGRKAAPLRSI